MSILWGDVAKGRGSLWEILKANSNKDEVLHFLSEQLDKLVQAVSEDKVPEMVACMCELLAPWKSAVGLMEEVESWISRGNQAMAGEQAGVRVMTFQAAKGLEADVVCIVGLEEGGLPHDGDDTEQLPEQARLLFVSMTRAKTDLNLFYSRQRSAGVTFRNIHGPTGPHILERSRFLGVLPRDAVREVYHRALGARGKASPE